MPEARVAFVNTFAQVSGANLSLLVLLKHLDRARFEPIVFLPHRDARPIYADLEACGIRVESVKMLRPNWRPFSWVSLRFFLSLIPTVLDLCRQFKKHRVSLVALNGMWNLQGALAAVFSRRPLVWWIRESHFPRWVIRIMAVIIASLSTEIVAISHDVRRQFFGERKLENVTVIYNGVECSGVSPVPSPELRRQLRLHEGQLVIGSIGPLYPPKGQISLVRAMARIVQKKRDVALLLIGGELESQRAYAQMIRDEIRALDLEQRTRLLGFRRDLPELLALVDVYVQPSLSEAFGRGVVEAMWAERPVVASDVGGLREVVVHGQTGLLSPPGDPEALADAILFLLDNPDARVRMGAAGKRRVESTFNIVDLTKRTEEILERAARARS